MRYGSERPLGLEEMSQLRANGPYLLSKLLVTEELLNLLRASRAITDQHKEHISVQRTLNRKITELVNIMKRRSFTALKVFISALHETKQSHVADALSKPGGRFLYINFWHIIFVLLEYQQNIETVLSDCCPRWLLVLLLTAISLHKH